jgi:2-dehydropantoate 2-reductase
VPKKEWPTVAVVGAGAVGCYFGGMLARAGAAVTLIGRAPHVDAINRDGLFIDSIHFKESISVSASTWFFSR